MPQFDITSQASQLLDLVSARENAQECNGTVGSVPLDTGQDPAESCLEHADLCNSVCMAIQGEACLAWFSYIIQPEESISRPNSC